MKALMVDHRAEAETREDVIIGDRQLLIWKMRRQERCRDMASVFALPHVMEGGVLFARGTKAVSAATYPMTIRQL